MRAFHTLNTLNGMYAKQMQKRVREASTQEEIEALLRESDAHFQEQKGFYKELGKEMEATMSKKWWQFWK